MTRSVPSLLTDHVPVQPAGQPSRNQADRQHDEGQHQGRGIRPVLHSRKGDCNEQSALFAAVARASGVPTRICTGLVYQGGAFYYHAWNEVLIRAEPECWAAVDPALRQEIADATHIKFSTGGLSEQTYINGLIGKIRANILEIETDDPGQEPDETLRADDRG